MTSSKLLGLVGVAAVMAFAVACAGGDSSSTPPTMDAGGDDGATDGSTSGDTSVGDDTGQFTLDSSPVGEVSFGDACAATTTKAQLLPLDMFVMLDQSGSMSDTTSTGQTKWAAVTAALKSFFDDPANADLGVGIQYFAYLEPGVPAVCKTSTDCGAYGPCNPYMFCQKASQLAGAPVPCATNTDCSKYVAGDKCATWGYCSGNSQYLCPSIGASCGTSSSGAALGTCTAGGTCAGRESCNVADYSKAEVEIAPLSTNRTPLDASLGMHAPATETPTGPALQGAIAHAEAWKQAHPDHVVIVVLATDGMPTTCAPTDIPSISKFASDGLAAGIRTYVIGVLAPADVTAGAGTNLDQISTAGNGGKAFVVSTSSNVNAQFSAALTSIRGAQLGCEYAVPTGTNVDYGKVNVVFTPGGGAQQTIGYAGSASACDPSKGGWYYDVDPSMGTPTKIELCPASCDTVKMGAGNEIDIAVGCQTVTVQ